MPKPAAAPVAAKPTSRPTTNFLKTLKGNAVALRFRAGRWEKLTSDGAGQRRLAARLNGAIEKLVADGTLKPGDDGLYRAARDTPRAVIDGQESPLGKLLCQKTQEGRDYFDRELMRAAEKLRADYEKAHLSPRVTSNYAPAEAGGSRHWQFSDNAVARFSDSVFAARGRVHDALEAVGPELSGVLLRVCCLCSGFEQAERLLALPRRSGKAILALGLARLSRHYGLKPRLRHAGPSKIGHWAVADYRPAVTPPGHGPHQP